jgi:hypothetical protein
MPALTYAQKMKQTARVAEHHARQARMPPDKRPRLSPKDNLPGAPQGVLPTNLVSMRTAVERPEDNPNDFRYLYRVANRPPTDPQYVWLDMDGVQVPKGKTYPTLYAALAPMIKNGWEDASW